MNAAKKSRLEAAKIAKAYIAGGIPPYQAARRCGFMRVSVMEEAFAELEAEEAEQQKAVAQCECVSTAETDQSQYLFPAAMVCEKAASRAASSTAKRIDPIESWRNDSASIVHYAATETKPACYRLQLKTSESYYLIPEELIRNVAELVMTAADLKTDSSEAQLHSAEREKTKELSALLEKATSDCALLASELCTEREKHNALKLRVFDILLANQEGK